MEKNADNGNISLTGEVVQTIEKDKKHYIKINRATCCIELSQTVSPDIHLGDTIVIEGDIRITTLEPGFSRNKFGPVNNDICED